MDCTSRINNPPLSLLLLFLLLSTLAAIANSRPTNNSFHKDNKNQCVYTLYIQTGSQFLAGTDSNISVVLAGADGWGVRIRNLVSWGGLMGEGHSYFEAKNLDIFSGRGPCLSSTPCFLNFTSDGSGFLPDWYCNYVSVTTTRHNKRCAQQLFIVEQWIAKLHPPFQLFATRNNCPAPKETVAADDAAGWLVGQNEHVVDVI